MVFKTYFGASKYLFMERMLGKELLNMAFSNVCLHFPKLTPHYFKINSIGKYNLYRETYVRLIPRDSHIFRTKTDPSKILFLLAIIQRNLKLTVTSCFIS